jgi:uncharacterized membrane protein
MRSRGFVIPVTGAAVLLLGCETRKAFEPSSLPTAPNLARPGTSGGDFATLGMLPALNPRVHGEAYAVDQGGSLIAGYSWDQNDRMNPVTWTLQNGTWTITKLPYAASASSAVARAVDDNRNVAGNDFPATSPHAVLWPSTGGFNVLGCGELGEVYGMSAGGQVVVGVDRRVSPAIAAVWRPGSCRENLPPLVAGGGARANAVNGDGTVVGGDAATDVKGSAYVPVRWIRVGGTWQIQPLDSRAGTAFGANPAGDLAGVVQVPCGSATCSRGVVWYAAGGSSELPTLGGPSTAPRAINAAREVVGLSTLPNGDGYPFIWSATLGMRRLPVTSGAWAFAVSGVRPDGTRLVVGAGGRPFSALVWVVRNP